MVPAPVHGTLHYIGKLEGECRAERYSIYSSLGMSILQDEKNGGREFDEFGKPSKNKTGQATTLK